MTTGGRVEYFVRLVSYVGVGVVVLGAVPVLGPVVVPGVVVLGAVVELGGVLDEGFGVVNDRLGLE